MTLSEIKTVLPQLDTISFTLPNGELVPAHFHVTEVGKVVKDFIDCGGTRRSEEVISLQLWEENDYDHRLHPEKLMHIIELSERTLGLKDSDIEVEYQGDTICKYQLAYNGETFLLTSTKTACLAKEACGIEEPKKKINLIDLNSNSCTPGSGCCVG